jgi:hypothetical protein
VNFNVVEQLDKTPNNSTVFTVRHQCQKRTRDNECDIIFTYERIDSEDDIETTFKIRKPNRICAQKSITS